jgi:hypothetical protein
MSLEDAARAARQKADRSIVPADHRVALALEAAVHAEQHPPPSDVFDTNGIPDPPVNEIHIGRPPTQD